MDQSTWNKLQSGFNKALGQPIKKPSDEDEEDSSPSMLDEIKSKFTGSMELGKQDMENAKYKRLKGMMGR